MKNKKLGFTLIELLAVIIILAIVALIATPIILDVIDDARISAGRSESNMILSGINNYCATEDMKYQLDNSYKRICTISMDVNNVKEMVNLGNATIDKITYNGSKLTELVITSNNHKFTLCPSGTFAMDDEKCDDEVAQSGNLISTLLEQYQEGETTGLVKDTTNPNLYYYTGTNEEVANNFLWYGGHQWRVLEFDTAEKTLTLITQQPLTAIHPASAVWDTQEEYESSYINKWLNDYFWNSLDSSIQSNILKSTFNVGIYTDVDEITTTQKVGLLDQTQYERAGREDSFLDIKDIFLLGNRYDSYDVRYVYGDGLLERTNISGQLGVRVVIKISDLTISGGKGTLTNSYHTVNKASNTNEVQVGEYINVPYSGSDSACGSDNMCTFRVVSKDNDSIKVVLNGLLSNTSPFGDSAVINTNYTIYIVLNNFLEGISNKYRYAGNKTFYIGDYPYGSEIGKNYEDVQDESLEASIGLPTVGEMFSCNDIDMGSEKKFVDKNVIENLNIADYYWLMNRTTSDIVLNVNNGGGANGAGQTNVTRSGVRPAIYLKLGLIFSEGEGTAQSPYILQ